MFKDRDVVLVYQYFYSHIYGNKNYIFTPTSSSQKLIESFISFFKEKSQGKTILGTSFLWNYFIFQFNYWEGVEMEEKDFSNRIVPSFILGSKAIQRFEERDQNFDWIFDSSELSSKYMLNKNEVVGILKEKKTEEFNERPIKSLDYGSEKGFNNCLVFTYLYNHKEPLCLTCIYRSDCKKILKATYPQIYKNRGYS